MSAIDLRRRLGNATYGEVMIRLANAGLPLPRAPVEGREADIARARAWLFPPDAAELSLFVVDTGPLITLAVAEALDASSTGGLCAVTQSKISVAPRRALSLVAS